MSVSKIAAYFGYMPLRHNYWKSLCISQGNANHIAYIQNSSEVTYSKSNFLTMITLGYCKI